MQAYLQFKASPSGPFQTVAVPCKLTDSVPWKGRTHSGYGAALPTRYMVLWAGRWHRVKVASYGNAGSSYIGKPGAWIATVDMD